MPEKSYITNNQACIEMWRSSNPNNRASVEMWRSDVSAEEQTNSQSTAQRSPSAFSDSNNIRPPSALSDDFRLLPPLSSDEVSLRLAVSAMNIASAKHQSIVGHGPTGQDDGYFATEPCSRASFSSMLAENGSTVCLVSERAVQWVVERERILNNRVKEAVEIAEEKLAELLRLVAHSRSVGLLEVQDEAIDSMAQGMKASPASLGHGKVSFTVENHPEDRDPIRPGTPGPNPIIRPDDYFADDEEESPGALTRRTRCSRKPSCPVPAPPVLVPLQSPTYVLRALKSSEIWDEDAPAEPVLRAPAPLRPLRELDLLLAGHNSTAETRNEME